MPCGMVQEHRGGHPSLWATIEPPQSAVGIGFHLRVGLAGLAVALVIDISARRIVGWRIGSSMHTDFVLGAWEQAPYDRQSRHTGGLVHHSDQGSQYVSIRYTERLDEAGIEPSVGSREDSSANVLAETFNGLYKAEVMHHRGPWKPRHPWMLAPHWNGCRGSTITACWRLSDIFSRRKPKKIIIGN